MSQKKIFLIVVAISTVSLLLHQGGHWNWTMEVFHTGCPVLRSHPAPGLKPKHTNVAFLKTHKTASSTMQNLLFRFAERNNLTVALPIQGCGHQFCYPRVFTTHFVHPHVQTPNIITNHMRFSKTELQRLMPNDTIYITILREPVSMFESLFTYYYQHCQSFKRVTNGSLEAFLKDPKHYYRADEKDSMYAHNTLTFDLGGDKDRTKDAAYAQAFLMEVEQNFSLVMIAEYFDESLVLLRHLLSWDLDDILYVKLNMRAEGSKRNLTPSLPAKIRAWNTLDALLYDHFNASLWRQLSALGLDCVATEVRLLRQAQERLMRSCFGGSTPLERTATQIKNKELRPWQPSGKVAIVGYDLPVKPSQGFSKEAQDLCLKLIMPEISYSRTIFRSQSLRYQPRTSTQSQVSQRFTRTVLTRRPQVPQNQSPSGTGSISSSKSATGSQDQHIKLGPNSSQTQESHTKK